MSSMWCWRLSSWSLLLRRGLIQAAAASLVEVRNDSLSGYTAVSLVLMVGQLFRCQTPFEKILFLEQPFRRQTPFQKIHFDAESILKVSCRCWASLFKTAFASLAFILDAFRMQDPFRFCFLVRHHPFAKFILEAGSLFNVPLEKADCLLELPCCKLYMYIYF